MVDEEPSLVLLVNDGKSLAKMVTVTMVDDEDSVLLIGRGG